MPIPIKHQKLIGRIFRMGQICLLLEAVMLCALGFDQLDSPSRLADLFARPAKIQHRVTSCDTYVPLTSLTYRDRYSIYITFSTDLMNEERMEYFDFTDNTPKSMHFWQAEGVELELACRDSAGRRVDLAKPYSFVNFILSKENTGQLFRTLAIHQEESSSATVSLKVLANCETFLDLQPSIYIRSDHSNSIQAARLGIVLLGLSIILGVLRFSIRRWLAARRSRPETVQE